MKHLASFRLFAVAAFILASFGLAKSLPQMAPSQPVFALYTHNLAVKKAFLVDFQAELKRQKLTLEDIFALIGENDPNFEEDKEEIQRYLKFFSLDAVGEEGLLAVYPDGSVLGMARPSASIREAFFQDLKELLDETKEQNGWRVQLLDSGGDFVFLVGYRDDVAFFAWAPTPAIDQAIATAFLIGSGSFGISFPLAGDVTFFLDMAPLDPIIAGAGDMLPPEILNALLTPRQFAMATRLVKQGVESESRFVLDLEKDPKLAELFLSRCELWPLDEFPKANAVTSYCFSLPKLGAYLTELSATLGMPMEIDLNAFGDRQAVVSVARPPQDPAEAMNNPFGDTLLYLEVKDDLTAETTLMSWLQMFAASSTPEGEGGFEVTRYRVGPYEGKKITLGIGQPIYLFNLGDRLVLATSEAAAQLLTAPKLKDDPGYQTWKKRYPADAVLAGFGYARGTFRAAAEELALSLPMIAEGPEDLRIMRELSERMKNFFYFVDERLGVTQSYSVVRGNTRLSYGFTEVRW